ncbi:hypothetical protein EHQ96_16780 [Leptospira levettii]|uniref:hypothetical protein n=1 Tax=Leptospira levettii TaxID=2023178 RepID=UPI0010845841|nr:hypothetical protein [Leptospira levettii]TGM65478.1 hypothetical protein EHQ96_16780 [Leptospira levettii]
MILNPPNRYDFDLLNDEDSDLYTYTFDLAKLEKISPNYGQSVWESLTNALKDFVPDKFTNFVIFSGDDFYDGLPYSYQIGILGDIENNLHKNLMQEFEKHEAFSEFYLSENEYLIAQYRFYKKKVYIYNQFESESYFDETVGRKVYPRYLLHEDMMGYLSESFKILN